MKRFIAIAAVGLTLFVAASCSGQGAAPPAATPTVSSGPEKDLSTVSVQAPIESVAIGFALGRPQEAELKVVSGLPDSCYSLETHSLTREGDTFRVEVTNLRQVGSDVICAQVYGTVENVIPLAGKIEPCATYTVVVNGEEHSVQALDPAVRCGQDSETPTPPDGTHDTTASVRQPTGGNCIPAAPLGVSVGETWTLAGPIRIEGNFPGQIPQDARQWAVRYTVKAIEDAEVPIGSAQPGEQHPDTVLVKNSSVTVQSDLVLLDAEGKPLNSKQDEIQGVTVAVGGLSPVLTLDWDCHSQAWFDLNSGELPGGGAVDASYAVQQVTLPPDVEAILFTQTVSMVLSDQGIEQTGQLIFGYDKETGRLVLVRNLTEGTWHGKPFTMEMAQQLVPEVTTVPTESAGREIPKAIADLIDRLGNEPVADPPASVTQYEYKGQIVYYVPPRCCDVYSDLYDAQGNIVAHPEGGLTGRGDGRVPDFLQERTNPKTLWEDTRERDPGLAQVLAPIGSVDIQVAKIVPPQYRVVVDSVLPNSCAFLDGYRVDRAGDRIRIEVLNLTPSDPGTECTPVHTTVTTEIRLGADYESGVVYEVDVNGQPRKFTAQ